MSLPLLVIGHGTRCEAGVTEFDRFLGRLRDQLGPGAEVAGGFIELAPPPLTEAVGTLAGAGHRRVVALPLVLVSAGHGKGDIPAAIAREQRRHPEISFSYGRPLGPHPTLLSLIEARIDAALDGDSREGTTVVLVGRGSTDPDANAELVKTARLLWEGRGYDSVEPCFISLASPSVPEVLYRTRLLGARRVVVAPYFLFPGVLPTRVDIQTVEYAVDHPDMDVRVADLLGDCAELASLVIERYREAITGDIRMNCDTCLYRAPLPGHESRVGAPQIPHHHPDDPVAHNHHHRLRTI